MLACTFMLGRLGCWIVKEGKGCVGSGMCVDTVVVFIDGNNMGEAGRGSSLLVSASRLVGDRSRVESKLCVDILATELGEGGMDMGRMLLQ